jgi:hypothetical protein
MTNPLDALLPPDPGAGRTEPPASIPSGQVPADLPRHLRDRLEEAPVVGQRSEQTAGLVAAAVEWGYNDGQVIALALEHRPTREKYGKRADREAKRMLDKVRPDHTHVGQPCDRAGCPNRPRWMTGETRRDQSDGSDQRSAPEGFGRLGRFGRNREEDEAPWPTLDPAALHGLAGDAVRLLEPHTEADPAGLLVCLLAAFGNAVGPGPHAIADAAAHPARLNAVLVGETARSRKGTAQANVDQVMALADPGWFANHLPGGLGSGEGLIATVSDANEETAPDKRVLVIEPEFARVLAVAGREGNTLSAILRQAWDSGSLRVVTRKNPLAASGAHISVVAHITIDELVRRLTDTEMANGFANRFLFVLVRRSKLLPRGGNLDPAALDHLAVQVAAAIKRAQGIRLLHRSPAAEDLWDRAYRSFADAPAGLAATVTARPEAQTLRLSVAYALLDGSEVIQLDHLKAALAVWRYCEQSAAHVFGDALGDEVADRLLEAVRATGEQGLDGTEQRDLFSRHAGGKRLEMARALLESKGLIVTETEETGGRPRLVSRAATR